MFLLDTNVISEVRKGTRCDPNVATWYAGVYESELFLSTITVGEVRRGVELARRRNDLAQANSLESWLSSLVHHFSSRIFPIDLTVAETWGHLSATRTVPVADGLIAATARVHGHTLVTRNIGDFQGLGLVLLDPFTNQVQSTDP